MRISVVIPSLERGSLLLETVRALAALQHPAEEILVIDQTPRHPPAVEADLLALETRGVLFRARRDVPSITAAMNHGAALATGDLVLFLDDDIRLEGELVAAHVTAHRSETVALVAGRILQPWHDGGGPPHPHPDDRPDHVQLNAREGAEVLRFGAGNVSIRREWLLRLGGFDENFSGAAYRFEADFAARLLEGGGRMRFEPAACVHHLHAERGGTRAPDALQGVAWHSRGRWYYLLRHPATPGLLGITVLEVLRGIASGLRSKRPWRALVALGTEAAGLAAALGARLRGPRLGLTGGDTTWTR